MYNIILYEDQQYSQFYPLSYLRPSWELRCGAFSFIQRLEKIVKSSAICHWASRERSVFSQPAKFGKGPVLLVNGRAFISQPDMKALLTNKGRALIMAGGKIAAFKLDDDKDIGKILTADPDDGILFQLAEGAKQIPSSAKIFNRLWELVDFNRQAIGHDRRFFKGVAAKLPNGVHLLGKRSDLWLSNEAAIEPGSAIDTRQGPVIIEAGARVRPLSFIEGPCYVGPGSLIDGAKLRPGVSVGRGCRLAGEIEESVILDFSNKHHDGFLGHSYVGSWVNLGAQTCNSDLKNNYGEISIWSNGHYVDSGLIKVGCFIGDHSKTAIGTMINTGAVIGVCCSVFGGGVRKYLPSFSWGCSGGFTDHKLEQALRTCRMAMARRDCQLTAVQEALIRRLFQETAGDRGRSTRGGRS